MTDFEAGYLCGWANGWGWAISPWVTERAKRLVYRMRMAEVLRVLDDSECDEFLDRWSEMFEEEWGISLKPEIQEREDSGGHYIGELGSLFQDGK